jgi:hypothetical protein
MSYSLLESIRRSGAALLEKIKDTFDDSKIGEICIPCVLGTAAKGLGLLAGLVTGNKYSPYNLEMLAKAEKSALYFSGQQSNKDTCALMSTDSVLSEKTGDRHPAGAEALRSGLRPGINLADGTSNFEKEMIGLGEKSGGYTFCSGTTDESRVMTAAGILATEIPQSIPRCHRERGGKRKSCGGLVRCSPGLGRGQSQRPWARRARDGGGAGQQRRRTSTTAVMERRRRKFPPRLFRKRWLGSEAAEWRFPTRPCFRQ